MSEKSFRLINTIRLRKGNLKFHHNQVWARDGTEWVKLNPGTVRDSCPEISGFVVPRDFSTEIVPHIFSAVPTVPREISDLYFKIRPCQDYKPVEKFCRNLHENRPETDPNENLKSGFERSSARNLGKFGRELRSPIAMQCITLVFKIFFTQRDEEELIADVLTTLEILLQGYPKLIQFTNRPGFFTFIQDLRNTSII